MEPDSEGGRVNIIVLAKFVPNPSGEAAEIGPDLRLERDGEPANLDSADEPGLSIARQIVQEHGGSSDGSTGTMPITPRSCSAFRAPRSPGG